MARDQVNGLISFNFAGFQPPQSPAFLRRSSSRALRAHHGIQLFCTGFPRFLTEILVGNALPDNRAHSAANCGCCGTLIFFGFLRISRFSGHRERDANGSLEASGAPCKPCAAATKKQRFPMVFEGVPPEIQVGHQVPPGNCERIPLTVSAGKHRFTNDF